MSRFVFFALLVLGAAATICSAVGVGVGGGAGGGIGVGVHPGPVPTNPVGLLAGLLPALQSLETLLQPVLGSVDLTAVDPQCLTAQTGNLESLIAQLTPEQQAAVAQAIAQLQSLLDNISPETV